MTQPIRVLIVDDEPLARRGIKQLLAPYAEAVVVGECRDGREALRSIALLRPDLVFLDIQMPGADGLSVARIEGVDPVPHIVFVTAHEAFAVQAFEAQALDYLVKPLAEARFRATMTRVVERMRQRHGGARRIAVPTESGELLLDPLELDWIEAQDDHAVIHAGRRQYRVRRPLAEIETQLDRARFVRIHRSAIVRLDHVRALQADGARGDCVVVLRDGTSLPVSRRRVAAVKKAVARS
jgi:two-component system LytT family response regulator